MTFLISVTGSKMKIFYTEFSEEKGKYVVKRKVVIVARSFDSLGEAMDYENEQNAIEQKIQDLQTRF